MSIFKMKFKQTENQKTSSKIFHQLWAAKKIYLIQIGRQNLKYTDRKRYPTVGTINDHFSKAMAAQISRL